MVIAVDPPQAQLDEDITPELPRQFSNLRDDLLGNVNFSEKLRTCLRSAYICTSHWYDPTHTVSAAQSQDSLFTRQEAAGHSS